MPARHLRRLLAAAAVGGGLALAFAAPGSSAAPGHRPTRGVAPSAQAVDIPTLPPGVNGAAVVGPGGATLGYATKVVVVPQGSPLTFIDLDELSHTITAVDRGADGRPLFNGGSLPTSTATIVGVDKLAPGSYNFVCSFHPNMAGTLIVAGSGGGTKPVAPTFSQPLRIPKVLTAAHITIPIEQADVQILPHGPATAMMTYGGTYPGPTIRRPSGQATTVTFVNDMPPSVGPFTVHLHGDHHPSADDGQPDSQLIAPGGQHTYHFPLTDGGRPEPGALDFYHDHLMGETGRDVWNGLQGMFIVDDPAEARLGLPSGAYDVPLDVADRSFDAANQLLQPFPRPADGQGAVQDKFVGQYSPPGDATVGDRVLVNGVFQPHLDVATHRYRLRVLNGSNFTSYDIHLSNGAPMVQVGTGAGLLPAPVSRTDILLGPAQRADIVVDFNGQLGKKVVLESIARTDNQPGGIGTPTTPLMQFRVTRTAKDTSRVPAVIRPLPPLAASTTPTMTWTFALGGDATTGTYWTVNGRSYDPSRVDASIPLGSTQTWLLTNLSPITHYIHLHEEQWRTLLRDGQPPPPWELGLQDVWKLDPGESVLVAAKFTDHLGAFMIHCHMLDHEDHGMMATFVVTPAGTAARELTPLPPGFSTPPRHLDHHEGTAS